MAVQLLYLSNHGRLDIATLKFKFSLFMKIEFCMTNFTVSLFVVFFYFLLLAPILCMGKMDPN